METTAKKQNYTIPILVMFLLFGMISFVTNLASPMGDILKNQFNLYLIMIIFQKLFQFLIMQLLFI